MARKQTEPNSRELRAIEYLSGLEKGLSLYEKDLEPRLREMTDMLRKYRMAKTYFGKVIIEIFESLPPRTLLHLRRLNEHSELVFRSKNIATRSGDCRVVLDKDLVTLANCAITNECCMCLKEGREIKNCEIRKALMNIIPLDTTNDNALCGYTDISKNCELEK